jgi:GTP cyclohydrolase I
MLNGSSPLQSSSAPGGGTRARDARERESLNTSIRSSFAPRVPVGFETAEEEDEGEDPESTQAGPAPADDSPASTSQTTPAQHGALSIRYGYQFN